MAMIDYGAVVIKNGVAINKNMFFMNMLAAVGWTDKRRIRHEDCEVFTDPDPLLAESNCEYCNRAKFKVCNSAVDGEYRLPIADCHGEALPDRTPHIDNNYFAYVGDQHFTAAFYKNTAVLLVDGVEKWYFWGMDDKADRNRKSRWFECGGVRIHLKEISDRVHYMSFQYKGDFYNIIYGYGIDAFPETWHKIKNRYLGKVNARKVDNLYRRLLNGEFR